MGADFPSGNTEANIRDWSQSLLNKDLADIATIFADADLVSVCAYDIENLIDTADGASIFDHANLTVAKAASIFDNTNLTAAKLISILDNANITSVKIKSIFETGSLSVDAKRAATLEGDQYTTADAATSVNGAFYTDADLALAFNDTNLTVAKGASIFAHANLTLSRAKAIFIDTNLAISKINSIVIHANITDDRAQQILSEIAKTDRDLTSAANIYELLDDWDDNKITSRDGAGTTSTGFTNLFAHKNKFRPVWTQITGTTVATGGQLVMDTHDEAVSTPSTFTVGTWEIDGKCNDITNGNGVYLFFMNDTNSNKLLFYYSEDILRLLCGTNEYNTVFTYAAATTYTFKVTRDGSGNFEVFVDDASKITQLDNNYTTAVSIKLNNYQAYQHELDNLKVY